MSPYLPSRSPSFASTIWNRTRSQRSRRRSPSKKCFSIIAQLQVRSYLLDRLKHHLRESCKLSPFPLHSLHAQLLPPLLRLGLLLLLWPLPLPPFLLPLVPVITPQLLPFLPFGLQQLPFLLPILLLLLLPLPFLLALLPLVLPLLPFRLPLLPFFPPLLPLFLPLLPFLLSLVSFLNPSLLLLHPP